MLARLACVGLVVGCYTPPQPVCGFVCGSGAACPGGYTCNAADNRCHLDGSLVVCQSYSDAGDDHPHVTVQPASFAIGVPVDTTISATFDRPVMFAELPGNFSVLVDGNQICEIIYDPAAQTARCQPTFQLPALTVVTANLSSGIVDLQGNSLRPFQWTFTTNVDNVPPHVFATDPVDGTTGISVFTPVRVVFDEDVVGVDDTTATLSSGSTTVPASVSYSSPDKQATLFVTPQLPAGAQIDIVLSAAIHDAAGNHLVPKGVTFITEVDTTAPNLVATFPGSGDTDVSVNTTIMVFFSEAVTHVDATTFTVDHGVTGTIAMDPQLRTATFTPDAPLPAATTLMVTLSSAITDLTGNPLPATITFSFTTL